MMSSLTMAKKQKNQQTMDWNPYNHDLSPPTLPWIVPSDVFSQRGAPQAKFSEVALSEVLITHIHYSWSTKDIHTLKALGII